MFTKNKEEEKESQQELLQFLYLVASFFESVKFGKVFYSKDSRFDNDLDLTELFEKLRTDLMYQLKQATDHSFKKQFAFDDKVGDRIIPAWMVAMQLAKQCRSLADLVILKYQLKPISKVNQKFVVRRNENLFETVYKTFSSNNCYNFCHEMNRYDMPYGFLESFDVRNAVSSLGIFVESLNTLKYQSEHKLFERILNNTIKTKGVNFFLNGYPHDILCHDSNSLKQKDSNKYLGLMIRKDYISTNLITVESDPSIYSDKSEWNTYMFH